jgi:RNA polymerase sigma-70 factor (ECF subfamily)
MQTSAAIEASVDDVRLAAGGDTAAFERLYRTHVARIHGLARRMVGPDDADDLTQEVFVRAWDKLDTFRGEASFGTWLYRLGMNLMITYRQSRSRQPTWLTEDEHELESGPAPRVGTMDWSSMDLDAALAALPDGARKVFVLHDVEGYRHEEIGEMLGIAPGTSKSQLHRARMLLRERLSR